MIAKTKNDRTILVFAFRYALGRKTYAPSMVVDELKANWKYFLDWEKKQIKTHIEEAISIGNAGSDCDIETWEKVLYFNEEKNER